MSLAFKVKVIATVVACVVGFAVFEHFYWTWKAAASLERRLAGWKRSHHLTDKRVDLVRKIEREYHGSGNPFTPPAHTIEEERAHSEALRKAMHLPHDPVEEPPR